MHKALIISIFSLFVLIAAACSSTSTDASKTIKTGPAGNNLTVTLSNPDGVLRKGKQNVTLKFADQAGKPVDVGAASLNFHMPAMGSMAVMNDQATLTTTNTPGLYHAKVTLEVGGTWEAQIKYQGPQGTGQTSMTVNAK